MSINRLLQLAGVKPLRETVADDSETNAEIERRLEGWTITDPKLVLDALEAIKTAGKNGTTPKGLLTSLRRLYPRDRQNTTKSLTAMINQLADTFDNVIRTDYRGWLIWRMPETAIENDVTPEEASQVRQMVDFTSEGMQVMRDLTRQRGSFSRDDLARGLASRLHLPAPVAHELSHHLLDKFPGMLDSNGQSFAFREEPPTTRDQSMDFLRSLTAKPKRQ